MSESPHPQPSARPSPDSSSEYFSEAFHASPAMLMIGRLPDGVFLEINDAFLRASGFSREEVIGHTALDLNIWKDIGQRTEMFTRLQREGQVRDFEAVFYTKQREHRYVLLNANLIMHGGQRCMLLTAFDLSERRRREQVQQATYEISRVLLTGGEYRTMFAEVQRILNTLMPARNFFVAMQSEANDLISYPYHSDEKIAPPAPRRPGSGLTEYVLRTAQPLLATGEELAAFIGDPGTRPPLPDTAAAIRLAVPLMIDGLAVGVIAVQDYTNPRAYGEPEKQLLQFVAELATAAVRRHRSEVRQRESQDYFAKSLQTIPVVAIVARLDNGVILEVNSAFEIESGYRREQAIGRTTLELQLWYDVAQRERFIRLMKRDGRVRDFEGIFRTQDQSELHLLLGAEVIELNGIPCMLTIGMNITERRRREQAQVATYEISRLLQQDAPLAALFGEVHQIFARILPVSGFTVALPNPATDGLQLAYSANPQPTDHALIEQIYRTGVPLLTAGAAAAALPPEAAASLPAGPWLGVPILIDQRTHGVLVIHDDRPGRIHMEEARQLLTFTAVQVAGAVQRRATAEALRRAEQQYRGIFENALEGLYVSSLEGRFVRANPALAQILGYDSPTTLINSMRDISRQMYADPGRRAEFLRRILESDDVTDFESEVIRPDGSRAWITESVRAIRRPDGTVQHFEGVMADITAKREVAHALQRAKEVADTANRAKSQFLASMSHELRTPLNGILGYTQILNRDPALTAKQRDGVEVIHQSAEHLLALINDVLDLAKIEAGKLELHSIEFNLAEFAHTAVDFFAPRAREKNLRLESSIASDLPRIVWGDAQRLRQVLYNLLGNAMKFTHQGAVIFTVERAGEKFLFSISDTGPGISAEDQARLFEPFSQVGEQHLRAGGTGLGLSVSRNIIHEMGGALRVESRLGWGSRFWFEIALPEVLGDVLANRAPAVTRRVIGYEGPRLRVLVADDHAPNRTVLIDLLQPLGFDLLAAHDGQQAIEIARRSRPDLVLIDLRMPRVDGLTATRAILDHYKEKPPCVIAVSASTMEGPQQAALAAGCAAFLPKPFFEDDLFNLIERHLHIVWREQKRSPTGESREPFPFLRKAPAEADVDAIFQLATKGDVMGVRAYAQDLAQRQPEQVDFAQHIIELATNFRMKAIRTYVSRFRPTAPAP